MLERLQKILDEKIELVESNDLVYAGYLCDCIIRKCATKYVELNLSEDSDEIDKLMLIEEYQELLNNELMCECNDSLFM